jgi:hypothetical protein
MFRFWWGSSSMLQTAVFPLSSHMEETGPECDVTSFYKGTNRIMRTLPSWPKYLPRVWEVLGNLVSQIWCLPLPDTIFWELDFNILISGGYNICWSSTAKDTHDFVQMSLSFHSEIVLRIVWIITFGEESARFCVLWQDWCLICFCLSSYQKRAYHRTGNEYTSAKWITMFSLD